MTAITDAEGRIADRQYSYDALSRLTQAQGPYGTIDYTYDDVGNRLSRTVGGSTETYAYASGSHRLQSVTGSSGTTSYTYDPAGNTLIKGGGERQYDYDPAGRLAQIDESSATAHLDDLRYNAHGQRFHAELPRAGNREVYHYDRQGRLIVEMDHSGDPVLREYVYLEGMPLAMFGRRQELIQGNTGLGELLGGVVNPLTTPLLPTEVFYFHTDHLGTPRLLTDSLGAVVWQGEYSPFGEVAVTTSAVENPLRFPGQRADGSGTYYNYFRDYDPGTGRYIQSDPIGLAGGLNTYGYVGQNSLRFQDSYGLEYRAADPVDRGVYPPSFNNPVFDNCMDKCWAEVPKIPTIGDWICSGATAVARAFRVPSRVAVLVNFSCNSYAQQLKCYSDCDRPGVTSLDEECLN